MDQLQFAVTGLLLGFTSSLHCVGMCGGIASTLALRAAAGNRRRWPRLIAGQAGRLASYTLAGAMVGALGSGAVASLAQTDGYLFLRWAAAAVLLATGFTIAGWLPAQGRLTALVWPLWERLSPVARGIDPGRSPVHAFGYGALWGWLPCGMVYAALAYSVFAGAAAHGALVMLAFGLGTLPAMLALGLVTGLLRGTQRQLLARQAMGALAVGLAVLSLVLDGHALPFCLTP
jgi:sulfite exporter TauE/SafE